MSTVEGVMTDYGPYILQGEDLEVARLIPKTKNGNYDKRFLATKAFMAVCNQIMHDRYNKGQ